MVISWDFELIVDSEMYGANNSNFIRVYGRQRTIVKDGGTKSNLHITFGGPHIVGSGGSVELISWANL